MKNKSLFYILILFMTFFISLNTVSAIQVNTSVDCTDIKMNGTSTCTVYADIIGGGIESVVTKSLEIIVGDDIISIAEDFSAVDSRFSVGEKVKLGTFKIKSIGKSGTGKVKLVLEAKKDPELTPITLDPVDGIIATFNVLSSVATLSDIKINDESIKGFASDSYSYIISGITSEKIKIYATPSLTTVGVNGTGEHSLKCGKNEIVLKTTSQDKTTSIKYKLTVNRTCDDNATLKGIILSSGTLTPMFDENTFEYKVNVDTNVDKITMTVNKGNENQKVTGLPTDKELAFGDNAFKIKVTSESGKTKTYKIIVNRADNRSNNALLSQLTLDNGKISFDKNIFLYETKVLSTVEKINVTATVEDPRTKYEVIAPEVLKEGENEIIILVTAENGSTQEYIIKVTKLKEGEVLGDNPKISSLTIEGYELNFNPLTTSYNLKIDNKIESLNISVLMEEAGATYQISGNNDLKNGDVITIKTSSLDGTENLYKITIEKSNLQLYILIVAIIVLIGSVSAIIVVMIKKRKDSSKNKNIDSIEYNNGVQERNTQTINQNIFEQYGGESQMSHPQTMSFDEIKKYDPTPYVEEVAVVEEEKEPEKYGTKEYYERVQITEQQTKQCSQCGHRINFSAKECPYCHKQF